LATTIFTASVLFHSCSELGFSGDGRAQLPAKAINTLMLVVLQFKDALCCQREQGRAPSLDLHFITGCRKALWFSLSNDFRYLFIVRRKLAKEGIFTLNSTLIKLRK